MNTVELSVLGQRSIENPSTPLSAPDSWLYDALGSGPSSAGINVSRTTALTYAAVWRAVNLIGDAMGKCPLNTWKRRPAGGRERAVEHHAYRLLRRKPNEYMTAFIFKKAITHHVLCEGNGYAYIERDAAARPLALLLLNPDLTHPVREKNGRLWYVYDHNQRLSRLRAEDVLHVRGLSFDGLVGYSVIAKARESLGLGMAAQRFGSIFFRNGSTPHVALEVPGRMSKEARDNLRNSWERAHAGLDNAHKVALLEEGVKLQQYSIRAKDAQLLETRSFEIREVANWFGLPPHKLGDSSRTAYNTLEQENQSCLEECFDPWMCVWEEEAYDKLLTEEEKRVESHEVEFARARLVQPALGDKVKYWDTGLKNGTLSKDEVREEDGRNPLPDGMGEYEEPAPPGPAGDPGAGADEEGEARARRHPRCGGEGSGVPGPCPEGGGDGGDGGKGQEAKGPDQLDAEREQEDARTEAGRKQEDDALEAAREKEDQQTEKDRDREDKEVEKARDKEDAKLEKDRAREDERLEKEQAKREERRGDEDADHEEAKGKEEDRASARQDKEDQQTEKDRDREDKEVEKARDKEDKEVEKARDKEDAKLEKDRAREDEQVEDRRADEDERDGEPDQARLDQRYQEDKALEARRDAEDQALQERREQEDEDRQEQRDAADTARDDARAQEDARIEEEREQEADALEEKYAAAEAARDAAREEEDARLEQEQEQRQAERDRQDEELEAQREAEDEARQAQRERQDEERQAERDRQDKELEARRDRQDEELEAKREAEDARREIEGEEEEGRAELLAANRDALAAALARMARRVGTHARRAARDPGRFLAWLDRLEADHRAVIGEALAPAVRALNALRRRAVRPAEAAGGLLAEVRSALLLAAGEARPAGLAAAVEARLAALEGGGYRNLLSLWEG